MIEQNDLVSVIMPFYNSNAFIDEALRSVNNQTYRNVEVILIVDTGSEIPAWKDNYSNIRVIYNRSNERGPGVCRYLGITHAQGRYLAFLDSDDFWLPDKLQRQIRFMNDNKFAFSFTSYIDFNLKSETRNLLPNYSYNLENFLIKKFTVGNSTVVLDRCFVSKICKPTLARRNDYEMWYYILKNLADMNAGWGGVNEILCYRRLHENNLTKNKFTSLYFTYKFYATILGDRTAAWAYFIRSTTNTLLRKISAVLSRLKEGP